ncbi:DUF1317 family protein [bacterium]|nr:DUF1317 family protein [bacterium]
MACSHTSAGWVLPGREVCENPFQTSHTAQPKSTPAATTNKTASSG